jgi:hypothetical protein
LAEGSAPNEVKRAIQTNGDQPHLLANGMPGWLRSQDPVGEAFSNDPRSHQFKRHGFPRDVRISTIGSDAINDRQ